MLKQLVKSWIFFLMWNQIHSLKGSNSPEVLGDLITMKEKHLKKG